jgi:hypothetical protein
MSIFAGGEGVETARLRGTQRKWLSVAAIAVTVVTPAQVPAHHHDEGVKWKGKKS